MGTLKFDLTAGIGIRGSIKREITRYCFIQDLHLDIREDKGLLDSSYYVTITGDDDKILQAKSDLADFFRRIS